MTPSERHRSGHYEGEPGPVAGTLEADQLPGLTSTRLELQSRSTGSHCTHSERSRLPIRLNPIHTPLTGGTSQFPRSVIARSNVSSGAFRELTERKRGTGTTTAQASSASPSVLCPGRAAR